MLLIWDESKRAKNLDKHGMDFSLLSPDFFLEAIVVPAKHGRYKAIGLQSGTLISVIFMPYGNEALSIISLRTASKQERKNL